MKEKNVLAPATKKFSELFVDIQLFLLKKIAKVYTLKQRIDKRSYKKRFKREHLENDMYIELVKKGSDGIVIIQNGILKFANLRMEKITGFKISSSIGKDFVSFVADQDKNIVLDMYKKRLLGVGIPEKYELRLKTKKGKVVPVEINASLINFQGVRASMAIIRDISERKIAEEKIVAERNRLEAIYQSTHEGLALYDHEGRVLYMNPALKKLFGVKRNIIGVKRSFITKNRELFFRYKIDRFDDSDNTQIKVYEGKVISNVLMKIHSHPIRFLEANYVPIRDAHKKVVGMSASFRDITLLKKQSEKIEKQLQDAESQNERIQALFDNVEEGVIIMNKNKNIISVNLSSQNHSGKSDKEQIGKKYHFVYDCHNKAGDRYPDFDPIAKVILSKETVPYDEHLHTHVDGTQRWVGSSYTPIIDKNGDIEQIVSVIRDITSIKELEKAKSEFVSLASHELRTPLTIINGYISLLVNGDLGNFKNQISIDQSIQVLRKIQYETHRLTKLVEELLNVSRIEEGRIKLKLSKIDAYKMLENVVDEFRSIAAMKGIALISEKDKNLHKPLFIQADKIRFKEILVNLIDNALKYTNNGGRVYCRFYMKNKQVYFEISDSGIGISESLLPKIFDKFQQESGSYLKHNNGHGLGLFIVKSLVSLHGGQIEATSQQGKGSTFTLHFPVAET